MLKLLKRLLLRETLKQGVRFQRGVDAPKKMTKAEAKAAAELEVLEALKAFQERN